jgi:prepilin-type processing-associated H-X9-DG protein
MARPSSRHRGGVNVAFADTHVIFLSEDIDYVVYMQLMTSNGRESDTPSAWKNFVLNESDYK